MTQALSERKTVELNERQTRFSRPDIVRKDGRFYSIFMPAVSVISIPLYTLGKNYGLPQLFTFLTTIIFAILNVWLITKISIKLGTSIGAGFMAGSVFLFGTGALAYSLTLTQHIYSVTVLLLMVLNAFGLRTVWKNIAFGALFGIGALIDMSNVFLAMPILVYIFWGHVDVFRRAGKLKFSVRYLALWMLVGLLPFVLSLLIYNHAVTGSYLKLPQDVGQYRAYLLGDPILEGEEPNTNQKQFNPAGRFKTRQLLEGFKVLLTGDERSWFYYSPVLFLGFLIFFFKSFQIRIDEERRNIIYLLLAVILTNILFYGMFGDVWGGWSFGARYLIPAAALVCLLLAIVLEAKKTSALIMIIFAVLTLYSVKISVLGAITTAAIPPRVEAQALPDPIPHTYAYNVDFVDKNISSSLLYNLYLKKDMTVREFWNIYTAVAFSLIMLPYLIFLIINLPASKKK